MDKDTMEPAANNQVAEQNPDTAQDPASKQDPESVDMRSFDELSEEEQQEILRNSFFGDIEDEDEDDRENDGNSDVEPREPEKKEGSEEPEKEPETDPAEAASEGETGGEYTPEEFLLLPPDEVDPSRLPQAARIVHERDMQFYRETILPQLDELKQLRQFRENVLKAQQGGQQQAQPQPKEPDFNARVKAEAMRRLGVTTLDDFNIDHQITVARVTGELQQAEFRREQAERTQQTQAQQAQQMYGSLMGDLQREYGGDFALIDRYAMAEMQKMPYQSVMATMAELQSGDAARIKAIYKQFADRYKASKQPPAAQPPAQKKAVEAPPRVIGGSVDDSGGRISWGEKEFARADSKEQVRMLEEAFFKNAN